MSISCEQREATKTEEPPIISRTRPSLAHLKRNNPELSPYAQSISDLLTVRVSGGAAASGCQREGFCCRACGQRGEKLKEDLRTKGGVRFSFIWASIRQAGFTSFWTILHILSDLNLRKIITKEFREVLSQCKDDDDEENALPLSLQSLTRKDSL